MNISVARDLATSGNGRGGRIPQADGFAFIWKRNEQIDCSLDSRHSGVHSAFCSEVNSENVVSGKTFFLDSDKMESYSFCR
jgi:hypothetical protein